MAINIFVIARILIGGMFIISGFEKLISPYQNFLYVVQGYELLPSFLEMVAARTMPWIEFILGVFLFLGLWTKWILRGAQVLMAAFVFVVSQALIRKLPLLECGCFGHFISVPLYVILIFDIFTLLMLIFLLWKEDRTRVLSLDRYFSS